MSTKPTVSTWSDKFEEAEIVRRRVEDLVEWENNPRTFDEAGLKRLRNHIEGLGLYKPLLINQKNIVLGGNMRLRVLKEMGIKEVNCSLVKTDNEAQMLEYSLSDNDQMGVTDEQKVAELASVHSIDTQLYAINVTPMVSVQTAIDKLGPDGNEAKGGGMLVVCPECSHEFIANDHRANR